MRISVLPEGPALALSLILMSGCASTVARVTDEWGDGPVRADRARPVIVEGGQFPPDSIRLPLLADVPTQASMSSCTVYGAWLTASERATVLAARDTGLVSLEDRSFASVRAPELGVTPGGLRELRPTLGPPTLAVDRERPANTQPDEALLLEVWLDTGTDVPRENCTRESRRESALPTNLFLIDFSRVDPVPGSFSGGGAFLIAVVATTGLLALVLGGG